MTRGPQSGSISAFGDSPDVEQQRRGDKAGNLFGRLVAAQLIGLFAVLYFLSFTPSLREWMEDQEEHDACMVGTKVMTCLDWGLNGMLFLFLFPAALCSVRWESEFPKWCLWLVWSVVLVLDVALFMATFSWRKYAVATVGIMVGFVAVIAALDHVPRSMLLLTWGQIYNWAVKVGGLGGLILVIVTQDTAFAYVGLAAPVATVSILFCCQLILDSCPPEHAKLGSMFVLFPEGLALALWMLRTRSPAQAETAQRSGLSRPLVNGQTAEPVV